MIEPDAADRGAIRGWVREGETRVAVDAAGMRLDRYLAARFTYRSRTQWGALIRCGRIRVNQQSVKPACVLRAGDRIGYVPLQRAEPPIDRRIALLYVDEAVVVVAKSGNLPLHPSGRYFRHTLLHLLLDTHPEWGRLHVVHRLDRETSGVVVFGRSRDDTARLASQFRSRRVRKEYLAIVEGRPESERFVIDLPLGSARDSQIRKAVAVREDGVTARTMIHVRHRGQDWALVEAVPETGRLHQIRVHLRAVGLPILGDKVYGQSERFFLKFVAGEALTAQERCRLGLARQALHAYRLALRHPRSGQPIAWRAPLPEDLAAALRERGCDPALWAAGEASQRGPQAS
ncbi:MAG: RluA family pseudouridine synthase [Candidatus Eisenbacteria bacterium]|nr:RluA family pseudouridine synthase [Candidatus Eisenbacteria bacterium]